jgi:hypothetical protein
MPSARLAHMVGLPNERPNRQRNNNAARSEWEGLLVKAWNGQQVGLWATV